jgi:hypothetical protein
VRGAVLALESTARHSAGAAIVTNGSVIIERVFDGNQPCGGPDGELWRVVPTSGTQDACVVVGKRAAVDLALARLDGTAGELYIRPEPDAEPEPFNPAGA